MTINHENGNGEPEDALLAALLMAYGHAELDPAPAAVEQTRRAVMAAARRRDPRARPARRLLGGLAGWGGRRPALALVAALLGLLALAGGTFAASRAGGPLYDARLWVETLSLPSEPGGRVDADLARLQTRLDEATTAASQGNGAAVQAALNAYRDIVAFAGDDVTRDARLRLELERHRIVLEALAGVLPAPAADALNRVLDRENGAVRTIDQHPQGKPNANGQGSGSSGGGAGQGSGGGVGQGSGGGPGSSGGPGPGGGGPASTPGSSHAPPSARPSPPAHGGSRTP